METVLRLCLLPGRPSHLLLPALSSTFVVPVASKNKKNSKHVNIFFCSVTQECQKKLEHKLGLDSYLLKPVQRITKYQLLLKVSRARAPRVTAYFKKTAFSSLLTFRRAVRRSC